MRDEYKAIGSFGTLGLEVVLSILFGSVVGWWADGKLGTSPALLILGFGFGCAAATRAIIRAYREMRRVSAQEEKEHGNPAPLYPSAAEIEEKKLAEKAAKEAEAEEKSRREEEEMHDGTAP